MKNRIIFRHRVDLALIVLAVNPGVHMRKWDNVTYEINEFLYNVNSWNAPSFFLDGLHCSDNLKITHVGSPLPKQIWWKLSYNWNMSFCHRNYCLEAFTNPQLAFFLDVQLRLSLFSLFWLAAIWLNIKSIIMIRRCQKCFSAATSVVHSILTNVLGFGHAYQLRNLYFNLSVKSRLKLLATVWGQLGWYSQIHESTFAPWRSLKKSKWEFFRWRRLFGLSQKWFGATCIKNG